MRKACRGASSGEDAVRHESALTSVTVVLSRTADGMGFDSADTALAVGGVAVVVADLVLVLDRYRRPAVLEDVR
jgi:hypothetical protein